MTHNNKHAFREFSNFLKKSHLEKMWNSQKECERM